MSRFLPYHTDLSIALLIVAIVLIIVALKGR